MLDDAERTSSRTAAGAGPGYEIDSIKPEAMKLKRLRLLRAAIWLGLSVLDLNCNRCLTDSSPFAIPRCISLIDP